MEVLEKITKSAMSLQDDETRSKIRVRILKGWEYKEIMEDLQIAEGTWDVNIWRNTNGFADFLTDCKKAYFLKLTEDTTKEIMSMDTTKNHKLLAIKQKESEFVRETLLKDFGYSKRIETIGLNINKNEPLDIEQKTKLDSLLKKANFDPIKKAEIVDIAPDNADNVAQ